MSSMMETVSNPALRARPSPTAWVITVGLVAAIVLGIGGSLVTSGAAHDIAEHLNSVGLITSAALLAVRCGRGPRWTAGAGFALLALAEAIILSAPISSAGQATFASGVALYVPALLLVSIPAGLPIWSRVAGAMAAVPFAVHASLNWLGLDPSPGGPAALAGYILLSVAAVGWMVHALRGRPAALGEGA